MRLVIQRVTHAQVNVQDKVVGKIERGLMILVGVHIDDTQADAQWLASKTASMRIFDDEQGAMNRSIADVGGKVLAVSQFTLHASTRKGNRPGYTQAAGRAQAEPLYQYYCDLLTEQLGTKTEQGEFGADMQVDLCNDGPVTIIIDSRVRE